MATIDQLQGAVDGLTETSPITNFLPSIDDLLTKQAKSSFPKQQVQNPGDENTIVKNDSGELIYGDGTPVFRMETDDEYEDRISSLVNNMQGTPAAIDKNNDLETLKSEISTLANDVPTLATNAVSQITPVIGNPYTTSAAPSIISSFKSQVNSLSKSAKMVVNLLTKLGITIIPDSLVTLINTLATVKSAINKLG